MEIFFLSLVVVTSFAPLLPILGWGGYGPRGEYKYQDSLYILRYSDYTYGGDKPQIFLLDGGSAISLIEVSDQASYVDGRNLYWNFTCSPLLKDGRLTVFYQSEKLSVTKTIDVGDKVASLTYRAEKMVQLELSFWRWPFYSVESYQVPRTIQIEPTDIIEFAVKERGKIYRGRIFFDPVPANITIFGEPEGLNKIVVLLEGADVSVGIGVDTESLYNPILSISPLQSGYLYPVISVTVVTIYTGVRTRAKRISLRLSRRSN